MKIAVRPAVVPVKVRVATECTFKNGSSCKGDVVVFCNPTTGNSVVVWWAYWPETVAGTQDDPIEDECYVNSLFDAVNKSAKLQKRYGASLRFVYVRMRIF